MNFNNIRRYLSMSVKIILQKVEETIMKKNFKYMCMNFFL